MNPNDKTPPMAKAAGDLQSSANEQATGANADALKIILMSDGTGNTTAKVWRTNVWRLFESLDLSREDQVAIYADGVGTSSFKPLAVLGGAFGWGLKRNVLDLYKFTCRQHRDGAEIYAFGFSRGAFTVRVVTGLILNQGLVPFENESDLDRRAKAAYRAYRADRYHTVFRVEAVFRWLRDNFTARYDKALNRPIPSVRFIGVWDTVAAYGLPIEEMTLGLSRYIWPLELPDRTLNVRVKRACHALALDDDRTTFHPVLWTEAGETQVASEENAIFNTTEERVSQIWFAGAHSNVGGGYPDDRLAYCSLHWMMQQAGASGLTFKSPPGSEPNAMLKVRSALDADGRLYDPRSGLGSTYRYGPRDVDKLSNGDRAGAVGSTVWIELPKIHCSVIARLARGNGYAPIGLPARYAVIEADGKIVRPDIRSGIGSGCDGSSTLPQCWQDSTSRRFPSSTRPAEIGNSKPRSG
jgi:uncharacterized protein (DUF2235 family)